MRYSNISPPRSVCLWVVLLLQTPWLGFKVASAEYTCDESRCRGSRIHPWVDDDTEFTCWVKTPEFSPDANTTEVVKAMEGFEASLMDPASGYCSDGYIGRLVPGVAPQDVDGEMRSWFTCCPPYSGYESISKQVAQTCVDTCGSPDWAGGGNCWADGFQEPLACGDSNYRFPRYTGLQSLIYVQFVCCNSPQTGDEFMDELLLARIIWVTLSCISVLVCSLFVVALGRNKEARSNGYNLYLIFLAIPDALANLVVILRNALSISGAAVGPNIFIFAASFEYFYAIANIYLNACIIYCIHNILRQSSKDRKKQIPPPSVGRVCKETAVVYFFGLLVFGWAFFLYIHGLNTFSLGEIMNVWITTRCLLVGPPILYVIYVCFDVWWNERLPISGRTRVLALYFLRVIIIFLVTWVPYFVIYEIAWNITHNRWMVYFSYYLGSVQGFLSVCVALSKPDVKKVFWNFLFCLPDSDTSPEEEKKRRRRRHRDGREGSVASDSKFTSTGDIESDFDEPPPTPKRIFGLGQSTKGDKMWEEDDVWGGEEDLLEKIMAADVERDNPASKSKGLDRKGTSLSAWSDEMTKDTKEQDISDSDQQLKPDAVPDCEDDWSDEAANDRKASNQEMTQEDKPSVAPSGQEQWSDEGVDMSEFSHLPEHVDDATVFYSVIVGFNALTAELPSFKVANLLQRLDSQLDILADKHKVYKVSVNDNGGWMGATNYVEQQQEDHTLRAARFALDAVQVAKTILIDEDDAQRGHVILQTAMMSGAVQGQVVGRGSNQRHALVGYTVQRATFLAEQKSAPGKILCTESEEIVLEKQAPEISVPIKARIFIPGLGATTAFWVEPPAES
ncbi:Receptor-type guanylate cyclase gcy-19 [Seminavis robusta]|uniref:Receptor-type guanylate cyclase gcy-19 n=1 Tax=Seminavis robusta TaxID=568900 RepID=A0A9N8ENB1_9STRA|nr:Receptor-type guanylate cyclase gcy-19 [Seminavis robusta]|eukprot:Sro1275_g258470.1 Receptor-type guanylate cyclase gcy-19 (846) ;mRNA; r:7813-10452